MTLRNIDLKSGRITYDSFNVDPEVPLKQQLNDLTQDMLQIEYPDNYVIDIGWYNCGNPNDHFTISVIKKCNWNKPLYRRETRKLSRLEQLLQQCIDLAEEQIKIKKESFNYLKENIDFKNGKINYYEFNIDSAQPLKKQTHALKEHLMQIEFGKYLVEVGWHNENNINGRFIVDFVKYANGKPIYNKETRNITLLKTYLQNAINLAASSAQEPQE